MNVVRLILVQGLLVQGTVARRYLVWNHLGSAAPWGKVLTTEGAPQCATRLPPTLPRRPTASTDAIFSLPALRLLQLPLSVPELWHRPEKQWPRRNFPTSLSSGVTTSECGTSAHTATA